MDADGQPIHLDHALVGIGAKGEGLQIYNFDAKYDEWISKGIEFRWRSIKGHRKLRRLST